MMIEKVFINRHLGIKFKSYIDGKCRVWFKAKEVAQIPGYKNTEKAIKSHVSENHKRKILFSNQHETHGCSMTYFIDEPGFYELVFSLTMNEEQKKSFNDFFWGEDVESLERLLRKEKLYT